MPIFNIRFITTLLLLTAATWGNCARLNGRGIHREPVGIMARNINFENSLHVRQSPTETPKNGTLGKARTETEDPAVKAVNVTSPPAGTPLNPKDKTISNTTVAEPSDKNTTVQPLAEPAGSKTNSAELMKQLLSEKRKKFDQHLDKLRKEVDHHIDVNHGESSDVKN